MSMETLMTVLLFWGIGFSILNEGVLVLIGSRYLEDNNVQFHIERIEHYQLKASRNYSLSAMMLRS